MSNADMTRPSSNVATRAPDTLDRLTIAMIVVCIVVPLVMAVTA